MRSETLKDRKVIVKDVPKIRTVVWKISWAWNVSNVQVNIINLWIRFGKFNLLIYLIYNDLIYKLDIRITKLQLKQWNASLTSISFDIRVEISSFILGREIEE